MTETSLLESAAGKLSRHAAERYSRRSFVGKLGRYGIAMTVGWAGMEILRPSGAQAHCGYSTPCQHWVMECASKWCANNQCPSGTCGCGSWCEQVSCSTCGDGWRRVADCCGNCNCGGSCNYDCPQSCCNHQYYRNGSCDDCDTYHIKCRRWFCANGSCGASRC
jgi:hypothetical protein